MAILVNGLNQEGNMVKGNIKFSKSSEPTISLKEALAVAYAAKQKNPSYIKNGQFDYHKNVWINYSNKDLVRNHFDLRTDSPSAALDITEADRAEADNALSHFKRYTLLGLGALTEFQNDVAQLVAQEKVSSTELGLIAYLPYLVEREKAQSKAKKVMKKEYSDSTHYGTVGEAFEGIVSILDKRFIVSVGRFVYSAGMDGHLFSFWSNLELKPEEDYKIKGKIKGHGEAYKTGHLETSLNYVKAI